MDGFGDLMRLCDDEGVSVAYLDAYAIILCLKVIWFMETLVCELMRFSIYPYGFILGIYVGTSQIVSVLDVKAYLIS